MLRIVLFCFAALSTLLCRAEGREGEIISVVSDGATRRALVYVPQEQRAPAPLVFVFHGRGGSMLAISEKMDIHNHWHDAIVVYPQGMWCEGGYRDGFGWVISDTDDEGRDIRFFDVLLDYLEKNYNVDSSNVFATGHSNGGGFTYALWALRGDKFKGFAPSAAGTRKLGRNSDRRAPKPVLIIGGSEDDVVPIAGVRREIERAKQINGCTTHRKFSKSTTLYKGVDGADVAVAIHPSGHQFQSALVPEIVEFFKYLCCVKM